MDNNAEIHIIIPDKDNTSDWEVKITGNDRSCITGILTAVLFETSRAYGLTLEDLITITTESFKEYEKEKINRES